MKLDRVPQAFRCSRAVLNGKLHQISVHAVARKGSCKSLEGLQIVGVVSDVSIAPLTCAD